MTLLERAPDGDLAAAQDPIFLRDSLRCPKLQRAAKVASLLAVRILSNLQLAKESRLAIEEPKLIAVKVDDETAPFNGPDLEHAELAERHGFVKAKGPGYLTYLFTPAGYESFLESLDRTIAAEIRAGARNPTPGILVLLMSETSYGVGKVGNLSGVMAKGGVS